VRFCVECRVSQNGDAELGVLIDDVFDGRQKSGPRDRFIATNRFEYRGSDFRARSLIDSRLRCGWSSTTVNRTRISWGIFRPRGFSCRVVARNASMRAGECRSPFSESCVVKGFELFGKYVGRLAGSQFVAIG